jgi:hypothetical protein
MKKFLTILLICTFFSLFAQNEISLSLTATQPLFNYMAINSFNPDEPYNQPIFLQAILNQEDPSDPYTGQYQIYIELSWGDATAEIWLEPNDPNFPVGGLNLTNQDFINNNPADFNVNGNYDNFIDEIEDILLDTGKMPDGDYLIQMQVFDDHAGIPISNSQIVTIQIVSPIAIALFTPGAPYGLLPFEIPSQYPEFSWISNFDEYVISVYELDENVSSPEDIEALEPHHQEVVYSNNYSYPMSANTLNTGTTYAWQVTAETITPMQSQNVTMKSIFYTFQYNQAGSIPLIDPEQIVNLINQFIPSGTGTQDLLNYLNNGYNVETITWQGQEITIDELIEILNSGLYTPVE